MDKWKLAWAAGFFQGEGYVGVVASKTGAKSLQIKISQHYDSTPLEKFAEYFEIGKVYGPYVRNGVAKYFQYGKSGIEAEKIIEQLLPFLSGKKEKQAQDALNEMYEYRKQRGGFNKKPKERNTKTHCPHGHDYATYGKLNPYGYMICKRCHAFSKRKLRQKKRDRENEALG